METRLKRFLSLALALFMVISMMPQITLGASAAGTGDTLYLKPGSNWLSYADVRFAVYFFNDSTNSNTWVSMEKVEDGLYQVTVPEGTWPNLIFVRMPGSNAENSWNNKWTQTVDLTMPTDRNLYTIPDDASTDGNTKASGSWSCKHIPGTAATCTTAQTCTVCGETVAAATGHDWENGACKNGCNTVCDHADAKADTVIVDCTVETSEQNRYCNVCQATFDHTVEAKAHTYAEGSNVCTVCGKTEPEEEPECEHSYDTDGKCTTEGCTAECSHTYGDWSDGQKTCSVCQNVVTCDHDDGMNPEYPCGGDQCGICGYVLSAGGHSWINNDGICANGCEKECAHESMTTADATCGTCGKANPDYVAPVTYVAQIGETKYETLQKALQAAVSGDTITVLQSVEITDDLTINVPGVTVVTPTDVYLKHNGGKLTIQDGIFNAYFTGAASGNSSVSISGGTFNGDNYFFGSISISGGTFAKSVVAATGATKMDITGGTFNGILIFGNVTTTISGGTFNDNLTGSYSACTITGGTFATALDSNSYAQCIADGYEQVENTDGTYTVCSKAEPVAPGKPTDETVVTFKCSEQQVWYDCYNDSSVCTPGNVVLENGAYTCDITVNLDGIANIVANAFDADHTGYTHTAPEGMTGTKTVTATWDSENAKWVVDSLTYTFTCTALPVAYIGEQGYPSLQAALDAVKDGETVKLIADCTENVTVKQQNDLHFTIDGQNNTYSGKITIDGGRTRGVNAQSKTNNSVTIQNINFATSTKSHTFIVTQNSAGKTYAHNVTVKNCTFTATGAAVNTASSSNWQQCFNIVIDSCTATNMHSLVQADGGDGMTITNSKAVNCKNGISTGSTKNTVIKNCTVTSVGSDGYGIRVDGDGNVATIENVTVTAWVPVLVRNTTAEGYTLNVNGTNTLTVAEGSNNTKIVVSSGDVDASKAQVTPTVRAMVVLNDTGLTGEDVTGWATQSGNTCYTIKTEAAVVSGEAVTYYDTLAEAVAAAESGATVKVLTDVTLSEKIVVEGKNITITADKAVTIQAGRVGDAFTVTTGATLTLGKNITVTSSLGAVLEVINGGVANVDGATIDVDFTGTGIMAAAFANESTINIKSGTISGAGADMSTISAKGANAVVNIEGGLVESANSSALFGRENAKIYIKSGEVKATCENPNFVAAFTKSGAEIIMEGTATVTSEHGYGLVAASDGKVTMKSGTVNGGVRAHETANAAATITGGTINGVVSAANGATMTISGGTFDQAVPEEYCALGYSPAALDDGKYGVELGFVLNADSGTNYGTIALALAAAKSGDTLQLLQDHVEDTVIVNNGVTLDLNGFTLTSKYVAVFNGSNLVDSNTEKGLLIVPQTAIMLQADNTQMPVWNEEDGYVFAAANLSYERMNTTTSGLVFKSSFKPSFGKFSENGDYITKLFADAEAASDNGLRIIIRLSWMNGDNLVKQDFEYSNALVQEVYMATNIVFTLGVTSLASDADVTVQVVIASNTGAEAISEGIVYKAN